MVDSYCAVVEDFLPKVRGPAIFAVVSLENIRWVTQNYGLRARARTTQEFEARLRALLRKGDGYFRVSEDHVCLVLVGLIDRNHGELAAAKLEQLFDSPMAWGDIQIPLVIRAGFANFSGSSSHCDTGHLHQTAEIANETARERGNCCEIVSVEERTIASSGRGMGDLNRAMEDGLVTLDYQPKYRLADGDLVGAEALIRWRRDGIVVPPYEFISRMSREEIWEMTVYCIRRAMREMRTLPYKISIALNIDPSVLDHPGFLGFVRRELSLWDIEPQFLEFEITEAAAIDDYEHIGELLKSLRAAGHRVAIDDFGTGQATLQHFRNLPADEVKIDRQFITNVVTDASDRNITESIIELAHASGKQVVAEGIEDGETAALLIELGCDIGQGFFLGMPMSVEQFTALISGLRDPGIQQANFSG